MRACKKAVAIVLIVSLLICVSFAAIAFSSWICPSCGNENGDDAVFCPKCGLKRQDETTCPSCGRSIPISEDILFCPSCGTKLPEAKGLEGTAKAVSMMSKGQYAEADEYLTGLEQTEEVKLLRKQAYFESRILYCAYQTKDNLLFPETFEIVEAVCLNGGTAEYTADDETPMIYYMQPKILIHYQAQSRGGSIVDGYQRYTWDRNRDDYYQHISVDTLTYDTVEPGWLAYADADEQYEYHRGQLEIAQINQDISAANLTNGWDMQCDNMQLERLNTAIQKAKPKDAIIVINNDYVPAPAVNQTALKEKERKDTIYSEARALEENGQYPEAIEKYESIIEYKDSSERVEACRTGIKQQLYDRACTLQQEGKFQEAIDIYSTIPDFRDSAEKIEECHDGITEQTYQSALSLEKDEKYEDAIVVYSGIIQYKDSQQRIEACKNGIRRLHYEKGKELLENGQRDEAIQELTLADEYEDSASLILSVYYSIGTEKREAKEWDAARSAFRQAGDYSDAPIQIKETTYQEAVDLEASGNQEGAYGLFMSLGNYSDAFERANKPYYDLGVQKRDAQEWEEAVAAFEHAGEYSDAPTQILATYYAKGVAKRSETKWDEAIAAFECAKGYSDATTQVYATYYAEGKAKRSAHDWDGAREAFKNANNYADATLQINETTYQEASDLEASGDQEGAYQLFIGLGRFHDSFERANKPYYDLGIQKRDAQEWDAAVAAFEHAGSYLDSPEQISETIYQRASMLYNEQKYEEAYVVFLDIIDYKDVASLLSNDKKFKPIRKNRLAAFKKKKGTVLFGRYEQDNNLTNGPEDIEWIVLDVKKNKSFLVSVYGLDCLPFNASEEYVTWEKSSIRAWLNNDFLHAAFNKREQATILETTADNSTPFSLSYKWTDKARAHNGKPNPNYGKTTTKKYETVSSNDTKDKVFLLSCNEAKKYLGVSMKRNEKVKIQPTEYVSNSGYGWLDTSYWVLRSVSTNQNHPCTVSSDFSTLSGDRCLIRPALWVNLDDLY